jgi:hypothetical protein
LLPGGRTERIGRKTKSKMGLMNANATIVVTAIAMQH